MPNHCAGLQDGCVRGCVDNLFAIAEGCNAIVVYTYYKHNYFDFAIDRVLINTNNGTYY